MIISGRVGAWQEAYIRPIYEFAAGDWPIELMDIDEDVFYFSDKWFFDWPEPAWTLHALNYTGSWEQQQEQRQQKEQQQHRQQQQRNISFVFVVGVVDNCSWLNNDFFFPKLTH